MLQIRSRLGGKIAKLIETKFVAEVNWLFKFELPARWRAHSFFSSKPSSSQQLSAISGSSLVNKPTNVTMSLDNECLRLGFNWAPQISKTWKMSFFSRSLSGNFFLWPQNYRKNLVNKLRSRALFFRQGSTWLSAALPWGKITK